jgi:hypothetical protein
MVKHFCSITCVIVGVALVSLVPAVAIELQPGTWQETETGTENGKPVPATTDTSCMSRKRPRIRSRACRPRKT